MVAEPIVAATISSISIVDQASMARLPSAVGVTTMFAPNGSPSHSSAIRSGSVVVARNRLSSASRRPTMMPVLGVQSYRTV